MLLLKAAGIEKGSGTPNKDKKGKVTEKQIIEIAKQKMPDMNANTVEAAAKTIRRHCTFDGHRSRSVSSFDPGNMRAQSADGSPSTLRSLCVLRFAYSHGIMISSLWRRFLPA